MFVCISHSIKKKGVQVNRKIHLLLLIAFGLIAIPAASAQTGVTGIFENFTANKQSGDLDGIRVVMIKSGTDYHAIVQVAAGGIDEPEPVFVPVTVKGRAVEFKVGETKYTGTVTATRMRLKADGGAMEVLRRKACASYFR
jgi:hypothetical protein